MDFYQKYELLDLLKDEGVKAFNAREISTGRRITIFLFVGEQARLHVDLLEQLRKSQRSGRADLLEVGDNQGTPFVVTEPLGGLAELKRKVAVSPAPAAAPRAGRPPDAFTRVGVWHIPSSTLSDERGGTHVAGPTGAVTSPTAPMPPPLEAPPAPPAQSAPGEFTLMFQAAAPPQPIGESAPPAAKPPAPPAQPAPDEFTRMFQAAAPPPPSSPPPAPAGAADFTRFFQSPLSQAPAQAPEPVFPPTSAAPPPVSSAPGEFTRIFGRGDVPAAQAYTPAPSTEPGEYTQMFSAQPVVQPQAPAPAPTPAPIAGKKVPWLTLALIVAVVVLLAVVVIMAFALRK
jgi:hypothetical protein